MSNKILIALKFPSMLVMMEEMNWEGLRQILQKKFTILDCVKDEKRAILILESECNISSIEELTETEVMKYETLAQGKPRLTTVKTQ